MLVDKCIVGELIWLLCWNSKLLETSFNVLLYMLVIWAKGQFCGIFCLPRLWHNNKAGAWVSPRSGPTFTISQDARRKGGTGHRQSAGRMSVTGRWPHHIMPLTCSYTTAPNATRTGEAREEALGTRRPLSLCRGGGPGGETGQSSDLISQEGKEQGGARWIRALPSLYFIPFPS